MFNTSAMMMFIDEYSALNDNNVVKVPGPDNSGNANGTIDDIPSGESCLKISRPHTISSDMINKTIAPATENDFKSTPNSPSVASPRYMNIADITNATIVVFIGAMFTPFSWSDTTIGIEPNMSITANKTMNDDNISSPFISISL